MITEKFVSGASEDEAKFLSRFKNEAVIRACPGLTRYQYTQFRHGAFVREETRYLIERFYLKHLEDVGLIIEHVGGGNERT